MFRRTLIVAVAAIATITTAGTTAGRANAAIVADLSTPKAAAKSLFAAISAGDRDGVRAALYAGDDAQAQLAAAMAEFIVANKQLGDAAKGKFGAAGDPI